jgi:hypothetical protein
MQGAFKVSAMALRSAARLAIHRRADEMAFLQHQLRALGDQDLDHHTQQSGPGVGQDVPAKVIERERDLIDELVHTRHTEPLGETLQRRLVMAEHICHNLARPEVNDPRHLPNAYWMAEIERQALAQVLKQWWAWLHGP